MAPERGRRNPERREIMGLPTIITGPSGTGKSTSLLNFQWPEVGIINVAGKPLPFRKHLPIINNAGYPEIYRVLSKPDRKVYVIDDSQYLMAFEGFARAKESGYGKFTDMAVNFYNLIRYISTQTPPDVIVYFLHHSELGDDGVYKVKTYGKMLDSQLCVEGLFSIVLFAGVQGTEHYFLTQSDGSNTAKSPMGMFKDVKIPNDLKMVDTTIREYYGMAPSMPAQAQAQEQPQQQ